MFLANNKMIDAKAIIYVVLISVEKSQNQFVCMNSISDNPVQHFKSEWSKYQNKL